MSFGGFSSKSGSGCVSEASGGVKMVADGLCSYNIMSTAAMSQTLQLVQSPYSQPLLSTPPLSLAVPKMENLGEMGLIGESFDSGLIGRTREDELESRSGSDNFDGASGDDENAAPNKKSKRKKYHRHTAFQIQELESSFKDNPHPDEKARLELGKRLGLEGRQVKFWFQNRRTQMKTQLERHENSILKQENDKLRIENIAMKDAMRSPMCDNCGSPAILGEVPIEQHHLMIENARLKDELTRLRHLATKFLGRNNGSTPPIMSNSKLDLSVGRNGFCGMNSVDSGIPLGLDFGNRMPHGFSVMPPNGPALNMMNISAPYDKSVFLELALAGMDELIKLAQIDNPLWFRNMEGNGETLNLEEYTKMFSPCIGVKPSHFVTEATRATGNVMINGMGLVEALMDARQSTELFPWNIGSASTIDIIYSGMPGSINGTLQVMQAEFQIPLPMVPVRNMKFIRFCKQHGEDTWVVVDISVDNLLHGNAPVSCRRLPSGCILQDMPNGCSKVTWIEHTEYDESVIDEIYRPLIRSGIAFGAQKWFSNLQRQCELFSLIMSPASSGDHSGLSPAGKKSMVKLAQRMTRSFCTGVCSTVDEWEMVQDVENIKVMMWKSGGNSGVPHGVILSASTTVWMPVPPQHLLEFLQNQKTRTEWDVLSQDGPLQLMLRIPKSQDLNNNISILQTSQTPTEPNQSRMLILQEICGDASGSLIVHAAVPNADMSGVMNGSDSSMVHILPSGFAVFPDCMPDSCKPESEGQYGGGSSGGSLLTIGYQILVSDLPAAQLTMESVNTLKSLINRTVLGIKSGLQCN